MLRISAKNVYVNLFRDVRLQDFIDFSGYSLSGCATSIEKRAKALAPYCDSPHPTVRRWITGETIPNGSKTLMIYGAMLALVYDGDQVRMLYEFLKWHDRTLLPKYFYINPESNGDLSNG